MAIHLGIVNNSVLISSDGYTLKDSNNLSLVAFPNINKFKLILNNVVYRVNVKLPEKESE